MNATIMSITNLTSALFDDKLQFLCKELVDAYVPEFITSMPYRPWMFSVLGSILIGLSGILPLLVIPTLSEDDKKKGINPSESKSLKLLLSFAVGGLLGDVFLHLLPEAWSGDATPNGEHPSMRSGLWVLAGILIFTIVEKIFSGYVNADENNPQPKCVEIANCLLRKHGGKLPANGEAIKCTVNGKCDIEDVPNGCYLAAQERKEPQKKVAGYLNLLANSIDNFTHGLAVAGSFLLSFRHGVLATFAILLHEIPHEVGDFAILLRSGFSRWDAAKAQLLTAGAGLIGALVAIFGSSVTSAVETRTSWIMPFTAGGFLHISLVTVLPDLLQETDTRESLKQFTALIFGIGLMAFMTIVFES
ncbi:zinc transporter ZIP13 homolog [Lutzomyia longipalpis]|uniref:Putative zinc transporter n=1 Tax=Lutzomyia longipalpis TaxID=7200 RepID=A0A1B0CR50_LUTLO|nr:zinc transporter ZIP13 homolog [Lutzomyia longipalpis]XP_055695795.1 zinc transporter ZIP13 homolog [Lutzomyia longipalpis]